MKYYNVTAHYQNDKNKSFHITYKAFSTNHAGALFVSDMKKRGLSVIIDRLIGEPILLSTDHLKENVVLDKICSI